MARDKKGKEDEVAELERLIGKRLYILRVDYGLTQKAVGAFIGVSPQAVSRYEGGDGLTVGKLYQIAKAMNVPISSFFPQQGQTLKMEVTMKSELEFIQLLRKMKKPPQRIVLDLLRQINRDTDEEPADPQDLFNLSA